MTLQFLQTHQGSSTLQTDSFLLTDKTHACRRDSVKMMLLAGVVLIILGAAALVYQGFTYTTQKKVLDLGPIQATAREHETVPIPPILGWIAIGGGVFLIVVGLRSKGT
jgi:hypothetical protein